MTKQRYLYWAKKNLTKILNPWDSRQLPNSVVCLDNLNCCCAWRWACRARRYVTDNRNRVHVIKLIHFRFSLQ